MTLTRLNFIFSWMLWKQTTFISLEKVRVITLFNETGCMVLLEKTETLEMGLCLVLPTTIPFSVFYFEIFKLSAPSRFVLSAWV